MTYRASIILFAAFFLTFAAHSAAAEQAGSSAPPALRRGQPSSWRLVASGVQCHPNSVDVREVAALGSRITAKNTAQLIVAAARQLLIDKGYAEFSLRNVAGEANLSLSNLQQFFATRDDLVLALFRDADARYRLAYAEVLAKAPSDRLRRFDAVLEFNFVDIAQSDTRRFFMQLWALLSSMDGATGTLLNDLYQIYLQHLSERIGELVPEVGTSEIRRRATLLAALIEGLMVVRGAHSASAAEMKRLASAAKRVALAIALGEAPHSLRI